MTACDHILCLFDNRTHEELRVRFIRLPKSIEFKKPLSSIEILFVSVRLDTSGYERKSCLKCHLCANKLYLYFVDRLDPRVCSDMWANQGIFFMAAKLFSFRTWPSMKLLFTSVFHIQTTQCLIKIHIKITYLRDIWCKLMTESQHLASKNIIHDLTPCTRHSANKTPFMNIRVIS